MKYRQNVASVQALAALVTHLAVLVMREMNLTARLQATPGILPTVQEVPSTSEAPFAEPLRQRARTAPRSSREEPTIRGSHQSLKSIAPAHQEHRPPKARHTTEGIDPEFLRLEAYTQRAGVGKVYDWGETHKRMQYINQLRKRERRELQVQEALQKEQAVRMQGDAIFREWLEMKQIERRSQADYVALAMAAVARPPVTRLPEDEMRRREAGWQRNTVMDGSLILRAKAIKRPGTIQNIQRSLG